MCVALRYCGMYTAMIASARNDCAGITAAGNGTFERSLMPARLVAVPSARQCRHWKRMDCFRKPVKEEYSLHKEENSSTAVQRKSSMDEEDDDAMKKRRGEQRKQLEAKKAEEQLKTALRSAVSNEAYGRLANVQHANPQFFLVAAQNILSLSKRVGRTLNEEEVLSILRKIKEVSDTPTYIRFERK